MKMSKNCSECPASWVCSDEWDYGSTECKHFHIDAEIIFTSTNNARDEIAAIIAEYSSHKYIGCESCVRIIKRLRQLSPIA